MSAEQIFADVLAMQQGGYKPFRIVKHVLMAADAAEVRLRGTVNDTQLVFRSGEIISFDGAEWRYQASAAPAAEKRVRRGR